MLALDKSLTKENAKNLKIDVNFSSAKNNFLKYGTLVYARFDFCLQ